MRIPLPLGSMRANSGPPWRGCGGAFSCQAPPLCLGSCLSNLFSQLPLLWFFLSSWLAPGSNQSSGFKSPFCGPPAAFSSVVTGLTAAGVPSEEQRAAATLPAVTEQPVPGASSNAPPALPSFHPGHYAAPPLHRPGTPPLPSVGSGSFSPNCLRRSN